MYGYVKKFSYTILFIKTFKRSKGIDTKYWKKMPLHTRHMMRVERHPLMSYIEWTIFARKMLKDEWLKKVRT